MSNMLDLSAAQPRVLPGSTAAAQAGWVLLFAVATAAGSRLEIPHVPVPFTLQTLAVLLAGAFLGARNGAFSQAAYLLAGVAGLPVFAGGSWGAALLLGPTGGYLLAFPLAALVVGLLIDRYRTLAWSVISMAAGLLVVFILGTLQLYATTVRDFGAAVTSGFLIFSWWDILKLGAAAMIYHEAAKRWRRLPVQRDRR
jgi:biotin transport system substrate-specific component